jgi:hypothetical protein
MSLDAKTYMSWITNNQAGGENCMPQLESKLGLCVICGQRVFSKDSYLEASEGYCHRNCIAETSALA